MVGENCSSKDRRSALWHTGVLASIGAAIFLFVGCSPESPKLIPRPAIKIEKVKTLGNMALFAPQVDILFVVDDSGSMDEHQRNLADNIDLFTKDIFRNHVLDYHIGVVTSSMTSFGSKPCCGNLVGQEKFVTRNTPNAVATLAENILVGINGDGIEKFFEPARIALSAPLQAGHNKGFYRREAHLAIIFITDAEEQSSISPQDFYTSLINMKRSKSQVLAYGAIIPSTVGSGCRRDDSSMKPEKLEEFLDLANPDRVKSNYFSLCDTNFGKNLAALGDDLARRVGRTMLLDRPADPDTIKVTYGSATDPNATPIEIPNNPDIGWTYDPEQNSIVFGSKIDWEALPQGMQMEVNFDTARL